MAQAAAWLPRASFQTACCSNSRSSSVYAALYSLCEAGWRSLPSSSPRGAVLLRPEQHCHHHLVLWLRVNLAILPTPPPTRGVLEGRRGGSTGTGSGWALALHQRAGRVWGGRTLTACPSWSCRWEEELAKRMNLQTMVDTLQEVRALRSPPGGAPENRVASRHIHGAEQGQFPAQTLLSHLLLPQCLLCGAKRPLLLPLHRSWEGTSTVIRKSSGPGVGQPGGKSRLARPDLGPDALERVGGRPWGAPSPSGLSMAAGRTLPCCSRELCVLGPASRPPAMCPEQQTPPSQPLFACSQTGTRTETP